MLGVVLQTVEVHKGMGVHGMTYMQDSWGGAHVDAVGLARGRSHPIPPSPDREAHGGEKLGCERGSGDIYCGKSVAPMFVEVSEAFVAPQGQYHNF